MSRCLFAFWEFREARGCLAGRFLFVFGPVCGWGLVGLPFLVAFGNQRRTRSEHWEAPVESDCSRGLLPAVGIICQPMRGDPCLIAADVRTADGNELLHVLKRFVVYYGSSL